MLSLASLGGNPDRPDGGACDRDHIFIVARPNPVALQTSHSLTSLPGVAALAALAVVASSTVMVTFPQPVHAAKEVGMPPPPESGAK